MSCHNVRRPSVPGVTHHWGQCHVTMSERRAPLVPHTPLGRLRFLLEIKSAFLLGHRGPEVLAVSASQVHLTLSFCPLCFRTGSLLFLDYSIISEVPRPFLSAHKVFPWCFLMVLRAPRHHPPGGSLAGRHPPGGLLVQTLLLTCPHPPHTGLFSFRDPHSMTYINFSKAFIS